MIFVDAERQPSVEVMALLVGLDGVIAFDVLTFDLDLRALHGFAVRTLYDAFKRGGLAPAGHREECRLTGRINRNFRNSDMDLNTSRALMDTFHRPGYYSGFEFAYCRNLRSLKKTHPRSQMAHPNT